MSTNNSILQSCADKEDTQTVHTSKASSCDMTTVQLPWVLPPASVHPTDQGLSAPKPGEGEAAQVSPQSAPGETALGSSSNPSSSLHRVHLMNCSEGHCSTVLRGSTGQEEKNKGKKQGRELM